MSEFKYQLSRYERPSVARKNLDFMIKQLEKYGDVEGKDFVLRTDPEGTAIYTLGERRSSPYAHYDSKPGPLRGKE